MPKLNYRLGSDSDGPFPARALFNAIADDVFVETLRGLRNSVGASFNSVCCERPGDAQPGDRPFVGARFAVHEDEVAVSEAELRRLVRLACDAQRRAFPEQAAAIDAVLADWD